MTARQLRLLRVLLLQDITDAVKKLDIALLRVGLDGRDESVRHGAGGLVGNGSIGTARCQLWHAQGLVVGARLTKFGRPCCQTT